MRKILPFMVVVALGCGSSSGSGGNGDSNHSPSLTPISAAPAVEMGQSTQLQARASDLDHDALAYSWSQTSPASPQGAFSSTTSDSPTWTAPTVSGTTRFTLAVTASDGKGGATTGTVTVYAKTSADPSFIAEIVPLFEQPCTVCHSVSGGSGGALTLEASNAYAALVNVPAATACTTMLRVKPGDPDNSVLVLTMTGATCGERMPLPDPTYFDKAPDKLALVRAWIQSGAPNN